MHRPPALPLPKIPSTVHATARLAMARIETRVAVDCDAMIHAQEMVELFELMRDWANANLENLAGLAAGAAGLAAGAPAPAATVDAA
jgi:hypothetical protein